jgi:hypothetical protein
MHRNTVSGLNVKAKILLTIAKRKGGNAYKQKAVPNMWCILVKNLIGWWWCPERRARGGDSGLCFFFLLSWKNCCIISEHSVESTPRLTTIFGWKGWTGPAVWFWFAGSNVLVCASPGKSLQKKHIGFLSFPVPL